jgi:ABC-type phosphate transport system substrate-binding protein
MTISVTIVVLLAVTSVTDAAFIFGGSSAAGKLITALNVPCGNKEPYATTDSGQGITNFCSGVYGAGFSDQPMTVAQDAVCAIPVSIKCTLPLTLGKFSFFVKALTGNDGVISLDSAQTWSIYITKAPVWATYGVKATVVKGPITRFCRSDFSGSTYVIERYWFNGNAKASFNKVVPAGPSLTPLYPKPISWCKPVTSTSTMCTGVASVSGAIGYAQVGACGTGVADAKLSEVKLKNAAGQYILSSTQDPIQAIPRVLPAFCGTTWSKVGEEMVLAVGISTAPIVTFEYAFLKSKALTPTGKLAKKYLICFAPLLLGAIPGKFLFNNVPSTIINGWKAVLLTIPG